MKAHIFRREDYDSDVTIRDIDVAPEKIKYPNGYAKSVFCCEGPLFYVDAVITFSDLNLPVGSEVWFDHESMDSCSHWYIFAKNKGIYLCLFKANEYTEDKAKVKNMLRKWAESEGIKFEE